MLQDQEELPEIPSQQASQVQENCIIQFTVIMALIFWRMQEEAKAPGGGGQNIELMRTSSWTILIQEVMNHQAHSTSNSQAYRQRSSKDTANGDSAASPACPTA